MQSNRRAQSTVFRSDSVIATNKVLRNTYMLLSMTILFSAFTAFIAMSTNSMPMNPILLLVGYFAILFGIRACQNNGFGVILTFALTGLLGYSIGPLLNFYIKTFSNGSELILMALGSTGLIFLCLSAFALNPKRNVMSWGKGLSIGALVIFAASLLNVFFLHLPALQLALSVVFAFISGGFIIFQTNMIVHGGERNYINATVTLYVSLFNIFITLLQLFGVVGGSRD
jgi:modulator of FtsH protease